MRRWSGLVAVALMPGCEAPEDCSFDAVVAQEVAGLEPRDCGDLPVWLLLSTPDPAPWQDAHDCVVAANAAREPFVVRWALAGLEGLSRLAYVGQDAPSGWSVSWLVETFDPSGSTLPTVAYGCEPLVDLGDCGDLRTLCIACRERTLVARCGD